MIKREVKGVLIALLEHTREERGMQVIAEGSRCLQRGELHELVTTDHHDLRPGSRVDRVGFLGFAEISAGGVVERGDRVSIGGRAIGIVVGFDACHHPNHYNILIERSDLVSGRSLGLGLDDEVHFSAAPG